MSVAPYRTECAQCGDEGSPRKVVQAATDVQPSTTEFGAVRLTCDECQNVFDYRPKRVLANVLVSGVDAGNGGLLHLKNDEGKVLASLKLLVGEGEIDPIMPFSALWVEAVGSVPFGKAYDRRERFKLAMTRYAVPETVADFVAILHNEGARWEPGSEWREQVEKVRSARDVAVQALVDVGFTHEAATEAVSIKEPKAEVPWPSWLVGDIQPVDVLQDKGEEEAGEEEAAA